MRIKRYYLKSLYKQYLMNKKILLLQKKKSCRTSKLVAFQKIKRGRISGVGDLKHYYAHPIKFILRSCKCQPIEWPYSY